MEACILLEDNSNCHTTFIYFLFKKCSNTLDVRYFQPLKALIWS